MPMQAEKSFVERLSRYYACHDTHSRVEMAIVEEVLPKYYAKEPVHPAIKALSYGETPLGLASELLKWAGLGSEESFVDLGCGCGALVLLAAHSAKLAVGVDLAGAALSLARSARRSLQVSNARFRQQDLLKVNLRGFDVVYCAATAVSDWLAEQLSARLRSCRPGARVLTVTHALTSDRIRSIDRRSYRLSWAYPRPASSWDFYLHEMA